MSEGLCEGRASLDPVGALRSSDTEKLSRLRALLRDMRSVVVAFSGGVDSATVLAVAVAELGDRALAITGRSPSVAEGEAEAAVVIAQAIGARHEFIDTREFDNPAYRSNPTNRCFYCKDELFGKLRKIGNSRGYHAVIDGTNADDGAAPLDVRPGRAAALRHGVRSPLAELGITKLEVRAIARRLGLNVWDKPASPCLSSRVPYGRRIEPGDLRKIDIAERYLRARGFGLVRVRHLGATARIEVPVVDIPRLREANEDVAHALSAVGYSRIEIDERGYRTGSLNEIRRR